MALKHRPYTRGVHAIRDRLLERFRAGDIADYVAEAVVLRARSISDAASTYRPWTNRVLMALAGTRDARGYREWRAAGRQVEEGSRAFHLLSAAATATEDDQAAVDVSRRSMAAPYSAVPVFRVEDTNGSGAPANAYGPVRLPSLGGIAEAFGVPVPDGRAVRRGCRNSRHCRAEVPDGHRQVTEDVTFLRDLACAAQARAPRASGMVTAGMQQDPVAELAAAALARMYGYEATMSQGRLVEGCTEADDALRLMLSVVNGACEACWAIVGADVSTQAEPIEPPAQIPTSASAAEQFAVAMYRNATVPEEGATLTLRAGDLPDVATADSYTLQTVGGVVSLAMSHGAARWREPMPRATSWTTVPVAVRMTERQFGRLRDLLAGSPADAQAHLALDNGTCGLIATVGRQSVCMVADRVDACAAAPAASVSL